MLPNKIDEKIEQSTIVVEKSSVAPIIPPIEKILKTKTPIASGKVQSQFSIQNLFSEKNNIEENNAIEHSEKLPRNHFSETDLQTEWLVFLKKIQELDTVAYNAINLFKISKIGEDDLEILFSSESAKEEFEKHKSLFINSFKQKVHHFELNILYKKVEGSPKIEIITNRQKFEKLVEINPLLKDLNEILNFDFS